MRSSRLFTTVLRRRRFLSLAAGTAASFLGVAHSAVAQPAAVVRTVLDNGLVVLIEERRGTATVALQVTARAGSRDDGPLPGLNLITSRMLFQGTVRRPSQADLQGAAAMVGGVLTRGTTQEYSSFACLLPAQHAPLGFDLLADLVREPLLDPEALPRQQQVARQELAQRRSNPDTLLDDLFVQTLFAGRPVGTPLLGTAASIDRITAEDVRRTFVQTFGASNLVLSVVGRIPLDEALTAARRSFSDLPPGRANLRPLSGGGAPPSRSARADVGAEQVQFRLGFAAPPLLDHNDRYAMLVLDAVVGASSGRLFEEVRNKRGLAYVVGSGYVAFTDAGAWFATAGVEPQNFAEALAVVRAEIERLRSEPLDEQEVADGIALVLGEHAIQGEGNAARARRLGQQEVLGTEPVEQFVAGIRRVTPHDVQRVAHAYLDMDTSILVVVGPPGFGGSPPEANSDPWIR